MLRRTLFLVRAVGHDPRLLPEYAGMWLAERRRRSSRTLRTCPNLPSLSWESASRLIDIDANAIAPGSHHAIAASSAASARRRAGRWAPMAGDSTLGELAYSFTRALRPALVVETGVSIGLTSAYILAAMADNELGELHSIDIPPPRMVAEKLVGSAVPPDLRDRWHYHWGSARRLLPRILSAQPGGRRIFLHDSEHSYRNMRWELVTAWGALAPGDVILCDDANFHAAFVDAARSVGGRPHLIGQSEKGGLTGLLVRT